ncbi:hypothetical protein DSO57_1009982 [Entomophthora muscae]|uniref:Uncharacterized protein n=1 Tax=Entomophthora muscae TaxID=34485 RepID=A0ACC2UTN5_9FUNG|nr:hypothetical protein DSO57_1009982 [Entomophthora muscae]
MIASQNQLVQRHREDRAREEERNINFEVGAHFDPTIPKEEKIDVETPPSPLSCHPSMEEWREVHRRCKPSPAQKPKKTNPNSPPKRQQAPPPQTPMETDEFTPVMKELSRPLKRRQGNNIPIPGSQKERGMETDFSLEEFAYFQSGVPGIKGSFWNPNHNCPKTTNTKKSSYLWVRQSVIMCIGTINA